MTRWENIWQVSLTEPAGAADLLVRLQALTPNRSDRTISMQALNQLCDQVMSLDHSTGLHAILLSDGDQTVIGRDVGRHNALDKAVGKALKEGLCLSRAALCSTGRLSLEMFAKAAQAGIPILSTRKQVGSLCIACAEKLDIMICRTGSDPACYSATWRLR